MSTIHSQVFTKAHVIAKSLRDNQGFEYRAAFSIALRRVWAEYRTGAMCVGVIVKSAPRKAIKLPKARAATLKLAEGYLRSRLGVNKFAVNWVKANAMKASTKGHFVHNGENSYIEVKNQKSLRETVACLAHELVHAQQVLEGRLEAGAGYRIFEGKRIVCNKRMSYEEYRAMPHEVEAFDKMYVLADEFLATM